MPGSRRSDRRRSGNVIATTGAAEARIAARAERTAVFGKTKMCKFHILGMCAKGTACCFAHEQSEMNPIPDLSRTKICKTLINTGVCTDEKCKYAHNKEELRDVPPGAITEDSSGKHRAANANAMANCAEAMHPSGADDAVAAQSMLQMQQWMAMMQYAAMMSRQPENANGVAMGYSPETQPQQATTPGSLLLYNAIVSDPQAHVPDAKASAPSPYVDKSKIAMDTSGLEKTNNLQQSAPIECVCGNSLAPGIKFCPKCGTSCLALKGQKYDVKNTFVDIPDPLGAKKNGIRNIQSASASLNSLRDESPASPKSGDGVVAPTLGVTGPRLPRLSTWASDLDTLDEDKEELNDQSVKRLQDTPLLAGMYDLGEEVAADATGGGPEGMLGIENMRVKNTFLEFKTDAPRTGMRMVRTAAGRLDLMGSE